MIIPIGQLSIGLHELEFREPAAKLNEELVYEFTDVISSRAEIDKQESHIYIHGFVETSAKLACDRCLRDFEKRISGEFRVYYEVVTGSSRSADPENDDDSDLRYFKAGEQHIDLTADVRDILLLSIPMKNLCDDDCKGICSGCGVDLNESECECDEKPMDPRWDALRQLLDQTPQDNIDN